MPISPPLGGNLIGMNITDVDRIDIVQQKLFNIRQFAEETLKILNYICIDKQHDEFKQQSYAGKAEGYAGQYTKKDPLLVGEEATQQDSIEEEEVEECLS